MTPTRSSAPSAFATSSEYSHICSYLSDAERRGTPGQMFCAWRQCSSAEQGYLHPCHADTYGIRDHEGCLLFASSTRQFCSCPHGPLFLPSAANFSYGSKACLSRDGGAAAVALIRAGALLSRTFRERRFYPASPAVIGHTNTPCRRIEERYDALVPADRILRP